VSKVLEIRIAVKTETGEDRLHFVAGCVISGRGIKSKIWAGVIFSAGSLAEFWSVGVF
jgi:hypothetical protein